MLLNFFSALSPVHDSVQYISHFCPYNVLHTAQETAVLGEIFFHSMERVKDSVIYILLEETVKGRF
jgi:hypothetical protein